MIRLWSRGRLRGVEAVRLRGGDVDAVVGVAKNAGALWYTPQAGDDMHTELVGYS